MLWWWLRNDDDDDGEDYDEFTRIVL